MLIYCGLSGRDLHGPTYGSVSALLCSDIHPAEDLAFGVGDSLCKSKGSFTRTVNVNAFVSDTFDLFNVMCEQHHRTVLNPFLNGTKIETLIVHGNES